MGVTLALSLAAECKSTINLDTWKKALAAHPEFSPLYEGGKGKFLEHACRRLAGDVDVKYLCWLLERRFADLFQKPEPAGAVVNVSQTANLGIPADVIERARAIAKEDNVK